MKQHSNEKNERHIKQNFGLKIKQNYITYLLLCKLHLCVSKSCIQYENKKTANTLLYSNSQLCKYSGHINFKAQNDSPHYDML